MKSRYSCIVLHIKIDFAELSDVCKQSKVRWLDAGVTPVQANKLNRHLICLDIKILLISVVLV